MVPSHSDSQGAASAAPSPSFFGVGPVHRTLEQAALDLIHRSYHVFPCRGKAPLTTNGFHDATSDERTILKWWDRWPDANIAIACGASGVCVLDIDPKYGADPREVLSDLELEEHRVPTGEAPDRCERYPDSLPGVRGVHMYFRDNHATCDTTIPGVELRGAGAYVIAPPSIHESGVRYEGYVPCPIGETNPLPETVLAIMPAQRNGFTVHPVGHWREAVEGVPDGHRNKTCAQLVGHLLARGVDPFVTLELMLAWDRRNNPPLGDDIVARTVDSVAGREADKWA